MGKRRRIKIDTKKKGREALNDQERIVDIAMDCMIISYSDFIDRFQAQIIDPIVALENFDLNEKGMVLFKAYLPAIFTQMVLTEENEKRLSTNIEFVENLLKIMKEK